MPSSPLPPFHIQLCEFTASPVRHFGVYRPAPQIDDLLPANAGKKQTASTVNIHKPSNATVVFSGNTNDRPGFLYDSLQSLDLFELPFFPYENVAMPIEQLRAYKARTASAARFHITGVI